MISVPATVPVQIVLLTFLGPVPVRVPEDIIIVVQTASIKDKLLLKRKNF